MIEKINEIFYRNVSCFCNTNDQKDEGFCKCYKPKKFVMTLKKIIKTQIYISSSENDDENEISHLNGKKDNCIWENFSPDNIHEGIYLLVEFTGGYRKKTTYRYAAVAQGDVEDDGEIKIMCLNAIDERKFFRSTKLMFLTFSINKLGVSHHQLN